MILKLRDMVASRFQVERLAKDNADVTEIDFSTVEFVGFTAMHQFLVSFPTAQFTGMKGFVREQYDSVIEVTGKEEYKKNQGMQP